MAKVKKKASAQREEPRAEVDLEPFEKAVNEAAARVRGLWLGYIALLAYLFIAVAAVTHRDLLLQKAVKLPLFEVELPLVGFFVVAPLLLLINHFYLLLQLLGLGRRVRWFNEELQKSGLDADGRRNERNKLDTFVIVQMLGGNREERVLLTGKFLKAIALITLVLAPVAVLLMIQLQFLPFQHEPVTWMHRIAIALDLALLWIFWPSIRRGEWAPWRGTLPRAGAVAAVVIFSFAIATFPGEFADGGRDARNWTSHEDSYFAETKGWIFGDLSENAGPPTGRLPFARALRLSDEATLIDLDDFDKIQARHKDNQDNLRPWETGRTLDLRGRNLRGARFDRSDLRNVNLSGAKLQNASLVNASLVGASLENAQLKGASLELALLPGASLSRAGLQGVSLSGAELQGASLDNASMQGASLVSARLHGATLFATLLQGASLDGADLQGAQFDHAWLHGASLRNVKLHGASFYDAELHGALLDGAILNGATFDDAELHGVSVNNVAFQGTSLIFAGLWRVNGTPGRGLIWLDDPRFEALTSERFDALKKNALFGVEDSRLLERIERALEKLDPGKTGEVATPFDEIWMSENGYGSHARYRSDLSAVLLELACDSDHAPHVVQGLMTSFDNSPRVSRLEDIGEPKLNDTASFLLAAVKERGDDCPGVRGLGGDYIAKLRKWGAKAKDDSKPVFR